jgi:hypothetical protein
VVDGGAAFNLLAIDILVEQPLKQIVRERGVDARHPPCSETPAVLQQVFADHFDAGLVHAALPRAQSLESLCGLLRPRSPVLVKHPVQRSDHHVDANGVGILAAGTPAIEGGQQNLFGPPHCHVVVGAKRFILQRAALLARPTRHVEKIAPAVSEPLG